MDTLGIEGLRGIAAVGIAFFSHYCYMTDGIFPFSNGITYWFWNYASYFVDLFFVISGFVMVLSYTGRIKEKQTDFNSFVSRRIKRFYPLMVFTLCLSLAVEVWHKSLAGNYFVENVGLDNTVFSFVMNLLCLQGTAFVRSSFNAPSWYLSTVLIMYIVFYAVTYFLGKYNLETAGYFAMVLLGLAFAAKGYPTVFLNCRGLVGFFGGCILCRICEKVNYMEAGRRRNITIAALAALIAICSLGAVYSHNIFAPGTMVVVVYGLIIWPVCVFLSVCMPAVRWLLSRRFMVYLGKISFSMYLIHFPVMILMDNLNITFNMGLDYTGEKAFLAYIAMLIVSTLLCYYLVEQRLLKRFSC